MAYFEYNKKEERLYIRIGKENLYENSTKLKRSLNEKMLYFKEHNVRKTKGFELHHIVPLCWAKSRNEFNILDKWQNLAYIDAFSHAQITQNNNANVKLDFTNTDAIFSDFDNNQVKCKKDSQILYDESKQETMLDYNHSLLHATSKE